jgi:replicative DNA helicase
LDAQPTHDLSAETGLLTLLLADPALILPELRVRLKARDFFSRDHALVFQAAMDLDATGAEVSHAEVFQRLAGRPDHGLSEAELDQLRGFFNPPSRPADIRLPGGGSAGTSGQAFPAADVAPLLARVLARSRSRELARRLEQLLEETRRAPEDLRRHLDQALASLLPLAGELGEEEEAGLEAVAARLKRSRGRRNTGWPLLDAQERWFADGELALVLGRTGHGKTNLLLNLALQWLGEAHDAPLLFYSLEMTTEQLAGRLIAMKASASAPGSLQPPLQGWGKRLQLRYTPRLDVERLAADALRRLAGRRGGAIFVDSLTALGAPPQARTHGRRDLELAEVCRRLKELAVAADCPVIATVPARRDNLREGEKPLRELLAKGAEAHAPEVEDAIRWRRPRLEHLPELGLEAHADAVVAILNHVADYQEELDPEHRQVFRAQPLSVFELAALKHRMGALHGVELRMEMKTGRVTEA